MLIKIAWKNIWRNKTRSLVVIFSIIIGVWAVIFLSGLSIGMGQSYIDNAIENEISHIQIHHDEFLLERDPKFKIDNIEEVMDRLSSNEMVKAITARTVVSGMIASSRNVQGVEIRGIYPEDETNVTGLGNKMIEGDYLEEGKSNSIIISKTMAEKLQVGLRKKITLRFQDAQLDLVDGAFRVTGIFETENAGFDENKVFILGTQFNALLNTPSTGHEIAILVHDFNNVEATQSVIQSMYPDYSVQNYKEIAPEIEMFSSQINLTSTIFTFIVMLGLIFGIINTMLMAVLERVKEIGMLMAIGMNKVRVFFMIVLETIFLGLIGLPIGMGIGFGFIKYLSVNGLNLSAWSDAMKEFNMSDMVYPIVNSNMFIQLALGVLITSILASIYPALKAIRLRPVEAIRKL